MIFFLSGVPHFSQFETVGTAKVNWSGKRESVGATCSPKVSGIQSLKNIFDFCCQDRVVPQILLNLALFLSTIFFSTLASTEFWDCLGSVFYSLFLKLNCSAPIIWYFFCFVLTVSFSTSIHFDVTLLSLIISQSSFLRGLHSFTFAL